MEEKYIIIAICILLLGTALSLVFKRGGKPDSAPLYVLDLNNAITPGVTNPQIIPYGQVNDVQLGQTLRFSDFSLKLTKVELDNRCPADAKCSQLGTTIVSAEFVDATGATTTQVIEFQKTTNFGYYLTSLVRVDPDRISAHRIIPEEYRFTLSVQKKQELR